MKTILAVLFVVCGLNFNLHATPPPPIIPQSKLMTVLWAPSPTAGVTYKLYHSTNNIDWHTNYNTGTATNYTMSVTPGTTHWFLVTAVNTDSFESVPSPVYEKPLAPKPQPAGQPVMIPVTTSIQTRLPAGPWVEVRRYTNNIIMEPGAGRLFRSALEIGDPIELVKLK